ncbi:DUF983 domain-containing protein [Nitrobacter sp. TKz-YC02]|uniref:DUF983 domain-containing protein n=1 Tax=Nitrobacter sp. TKz-YC02 TaxID=3398704 RepID=UPI003CF7A64E
MSVSNSSLTVRVWPAIVRAVSGRCPACGGGKFFKSYLRQVDRCSVCGESFGQIHADDGPAWLTIGIVGHVVVPILLFTETNYNSPFWISMTVWPLTALALTLTILPRAKALFIAAIWAMKAPGIE